MSERKPRAHVELAVRNGSVRIRLTKPLSCFYITPEQAAVWAETLQRFAQTAVEDSFARGPGVVRAKRLVRARAGSEAAE